MRGTLSRLLVAAAFSTLFACKGDRGPAGADGTPCTVTDNGDGSKTISCADGTTATVADGTDVDPTTLNDILDAINAETKPETCAVCHKHTPEEMHQGIYDEYADTSRLGLTIIGTSSTGNGDDPLTYSSTLTFQITKGGAPYVDVAGLPTIDQKSCYAVRYDSSTGQYLGSIAYAGSRSSPILAQPTGTPGEYEFTVASAPYAPEDVSNNAQLYCYVAQGKLDTEGMSLYDDVANAAKAYGDAMATDPDAYASPADVAGCERCHGSPYMKHGYRLAEVEGLPDFAACKSCHYDDRGGHNIDWQLLVDNPARYAEIFYGDDPTADEETKYAYTASVMNDVHMSHAMEFPYPQSMANCTVCHESALEAGTLLTDANWKLSTCKSCHPVDGVGGTQALRAPALMDIWAHTPTSGTDVTNIHQPLLDDTPPDCLSSCHTVDGVDKEDGGLIGFDEVHNGGYNPIIYTDDGTETKYDDIFSASIDSASYDSAAMELTVTFTAAEAGGDSTYAPLDADDIVPTILIGLYGYDSKDFIVAPHGRDADRNRLLEFPLDGVTTNPRFSYTQTGASWTVVADLSLWAADIGDTIRRAEIAVMPTLSRVVNDVDVSVGTCDPECGHSEHCNAGNACVENDDEMLAVTAPSRTFDFTSGTTGDFDDYFGDIVDVANGCNNCHEALATTFHSPNRGGNIKVCRLCHVGLSGGSHLELQSRSIDSYVHAIHSFQVFDPGDVDFDNDVERMFYDLHIEHTYPNFTIKNCESCHNAGKYNVPDQSKSMPGLLSKSDSVSDRNIPAIPAYVTGPAARACGGCHRAQRINEDDANGLLAFFQHLKENGYLIEDGDLADGETSVLDYVIETIMGLFE